MIDINHKGISYDFEASISVKNNRENRRKHKKTQLNDVNEMKTSSKTATVSTLRKYQDGGEWGEGRFNLHPSMYRLSRKTPAPTAFSS
jgi:hypothetical protein